MELSDSDFIERLGKRVEEIAEAMAQAEVPYEPFTALAMAEFAVHITSDLFGVPRYEARIRLIEALVEMFRAEFNAVNQGGGSVG